MNAGEKAFGYRLSAGNNKEGRDRMVAVSGGKAGSRAPGLRQAGRGSVERGGEVRQAGRGGCWRARSTECREGGGERW